MCCIFHDKSGRTILESGQCRCEDSNHQSTRNDLFQLSNRGLQAFEHAMSPGHGFLNSSVDKLLYGLMPFRKGTGRFGEEVAQCEGELREVLQETLPYRSIAAV